jgi:hypothetical protein
MTKSREIDLVDQPTFVADRSAANVEAIVLTRRARNGTDRDRAHGRDDLQDAIARRLPCQRVHEAASHASLRHDCRGCGIYLCTPFGPREARAATPRR